MKELVTQYMLAIHPDNQDADTRKKIGEWSQKDPTFLSRWYEKAKQDLNEHPNNPTFTNLKTLLPKVQQTEVALGDHAAEVKRLNDEANVKLGNTSVNVEELSKGLKPETFTYNEPDKGIWATNRGLFQPAKKLTVTLQPKDLINMAIMGQPAFSAEAIAMRTAASKSLERSLGPNYKDISTAYFTNAIAGGVSRQGGFSGIANQLTGNYEEPKLNQSDLAKMKVGEALASQQFSNTIKVKGELLKEHRKGNSPVSFDLYTPNIDAKTKETIDRNLTNVLNEFKAAGVDVSKFESYQAPGKGEANKYSVSIGVDRSVPGMPMTLDLYDGSGLVQQLPIDGRKANEITGRTLQIPAPISKVAQKINWNSTGDNITSSTNDVTSNPYSNNAYKGAYYKSTQFKALGIPDLVGADVFKDYEGKYTPYFYVKSDDGRIKAVTVKFTRTGDQVAYDNADAAEAVIKSLSNKAQFDEIIKNAQ
jgi:hypothetical protein